MKSRSMQTVFAAVLTLTVLSLAAGCSDDDSNDLQRLVVDVQSVNAGAPLVSAYLNAGSDNIVGTDDDFQPIDSIQVVFHARPYGSLITMPEDGAYSWFQVVRYDLEWQNEPGVPVNLTQHNIYGGNTAAMVPVYEEGAASVLITGIDVKNTDWFVEIFTGDIESFQANAHITFYGHESGSDEEVAIEAGLRVHFIGVVTGG